MPLYELVAIAKVADVSTLFPLGALEYQNKVTAGNCELLTKTYAIVFNRFQYFSIECIKAFGDRNCHFHFEERWGRSILEQFK
jgi:hypothetical protein